MAMRGTCPSSIVRSTTRGCSSSDSTCWRSTIAATVRVPEDPARAGSTMMQPQPTTTCARVSVSPPPGSSSSAIRSGSAVAIDLVSRVPAAGLIVEGAPTSVTDRGQELYPYIPVKWIAASRFGSAAKIGHLKIPKLFLHARDDEVIPISHGRRPLPGSHAAQDIRRAARRPRRRTSGRFRDLLRRASRIFCGMT